MAGDVIHERLNHTERFAAYLRMLKSRSGFGFNQLGKLAGVSSSSLHRYCSGASVPQDYRIVLSFARSCGATPEEIRHLHRLWSAAEAVRHTDPGSPPPLAVVDDDPPPAAPPVAPPTAPPVASPAASPTAPLVAGPSAGDAGSPEEVADPLPPRRFRRRYLAIAAISAAVVLAGFGLFALRGPDDAGDPGTTDGRMLFSRACQDPVSMGQHDECVREVQNLLLRAGAQVAVDGAFGPETLRRVTAFQVLAGVPARGVVDDATKKALYEQRVRMTTWPPAQVEKRIRQIFAEAPDHAVSIARCQSRLDPLHITPNTNGSRNWGLFQLSDATLNTLGGTPVKAFDPEWNINAARQLWSPDRDFQRAWPFCAAALNSSPTPSPPAPSPAATGGAVPRR